MDAESISELDDYAFRELITKNIHAADNNKDVWELLTSPEVIERTHETLRLMRKLVEQDLGKRRRQLDEFRAECFLKGAAGKQDWFAGKAEYEDWKRRANSFRFMIEARQAQARAALKGANGDRGRLERETRITAAKLCTAIQRHQAAYAATGRQPEQCDYDLWRALDELTMPLTEGGSASLRQMLLTHWMPTEADTGSRRRGNERLMRQAPAGRSTQFEGRPKARHLGSDKPLA